MVGLGAGSGLLWRSPRLTVAGLGPVDVVEVGVTSAGSIPFELADDRLAFAVFPFDRAEAGTIHVPRAVVVDDGRERRIIGAEPEEVAAMIAEVQASVAEPGPRRIEVTPNLPADRWRDTVVGEARHRIRRGELTKVVLARQLVLDGDRPFDVGDTVGRMARAYPEALVFAVDGFVGASPELLVARDDRSVRALPLAGTAARSPDAEVDAARIEELRASTKDQLEHRITIEWLLEELLPFCSYVDAEPDPSVISLANVHHLATVVEGVLSAPPASILELVAAVHPTPALGGAPQARALEVITELEGFDRGRYGGPVGWLDGRGNGEFAVAVRSAQIDGSRATVSAGVGVVAESDPDAELAETQVKFRAALEALLATTGRTGGADAVAEMKRRADALVAEVRATLGEGA